MEGAGLGSRESSVAELGAGVRIRRAVHQQVLGPFQFVLYGREFITVEHCGDDFLAELAKTMRDSKDWDDLQAAELEACEVLTDMFGQDIHNDGECNVIQDVDIVEDSKQPKKNQTFLEAQLAGFVVDEAHCVSLWRHDFRPDYRLVCLKPNFAYDPVMALAETATHSVREDILKSLGIPHALVLETSFDRLDLKYEVIS